MRKSARMPMAPLTPSAQAQAGGNAALIQRERNPVKEAGDSSERTAPSLCFALSLLQIAYRNAFFLGPTFTMSTSVMLRCSSKNRSRFFSVKTWTGKCGPKANSCMAAVNNGAAGPLSLTSEYFLQADHANRSAAWMPTDSLRTNEWERYRYCLLDFRVLPLLANNALASAWYLWPVSKK